MREILFRAKRIDDVEWVEGFYAVNSIGSNIIIANDPFVIYDIDPVTLCQYTGLTDKNGVKIFEGDKVYIEDWECESRVYWKSGAWMLEFADCDEYLDDINTDCEVIGLIHDTPELIGQPATPHADPIEAGTRRGE